MPAMSSMRARGPRLIFDQITRPTERRVGRRDHQILEHIDVLTAGDLGVDRHPGDLHLPVRSDAHETTGGLAGHEALRGTLLRLLHLLLHLRRLL